jgi:hypothetical protein
LPDLPKLDRMWGYKYGQDERTGETIEVPLTLLDLLYPTGEEIFVAEGWVHRWLSVMLEVMLRAHLAERGWLVFGNVFVHWGRPNVPPLAPDVTAISTGQYPSEIEGSFYVGEHGPTPSFVIEITSHNKPERDLDRKKWDYAALGVPEYLIIDGWTQQSKPWRLSGYRLENSPFYTEIKPDAEGGLTFTTVGLRFVGRGRETVDVYDVASGQKLAPPEEWLQQAKTEAQARRDAETRAETEAKARAEAEAALAAVTARLRELEAKYGIDQTSQ